MIVNKSQSKKLAFIAIVMLSVVICILVVHKTPEQLAGDAKYIPTFFGVTESDFIGFDGNMYIVEEIHSQGRKWEDFGSAHYEIRLCELHPNIRREIEEKRGVRTDSTWVLKRVRGNIQGELVIRHNSSTVYAHFYQIYNE